MIHGPYNAKLNKVVFTDFTSCQSWAIIQGKTSSNVGFPQTAIESSRDKGHTMT